MKGQTRWHAQERRCMYLNLMLSMWGSPVYRLQDLQWERKEAEQNGEVKSCGRKENKICTWHLKLFLLLFTPLNSTTAKHLELCRAVLNLCGFAFWTWLVDSRKGSLFCFLWMPWCALVFPGLEWLPGQYMLGLSPCSINSLTNPKSFLTSWSLLLCYIV